MLSTALKDLAVEMDLFIMSSTQTNAKSEENNGIKNESVIRGARSIIDKCDIACVASRVTKEEEELLKIPIEEIGIIPNQVLDVYKVRRGRYTNIRIWSYMDLGTCRKRDLFVTDEKGRRIEGFKVIEFLFMEDEDSINPKVLEALNAGSSDFSFILNNKPKEEQKSIIIPEKETIIEKPKKKGVFDISL